MSVAPIVTPALNADGIPLMPIITAIYPFSLDEGSVNAVNCFLVKKVSSLGSNKTVPVGIKVTHQRVDLLTDDQVSTIDYGDDSQFGQKYRSKIGITPSAQLEEHTEYSVILSKDLSKVSVFDIKAHLSNTGTKSPLIKGPYTGLINDTYRIDILIGGNENTAKYKVTRLSDSLIINNLTAKKRFIEVDQGLNIKFDLGNYVAGDSFTVIVKPQVKTNEIYSWDFKTGDNLYVKPSDANSNVIIGLPVDVPTTTPPPSAGEFKLLSVKPQLNSLMNQPGRKAEATIQDILFKSFYRTDILNNYKIKFILDNDNPVSFTQSGTDFIVSFHNTTTKGEIVDLVNGADLDITASTEKMLETVVANAAGVPLLNGKKGGEVIFTFSKNIKATSFDVDKIQVLAESTLEPSYGALDFEHTIIDNKLIIKFL